MSLRLKEVSDTEELLNMYKKNPSKYLVPVDELCDNSTYLGLYFNGMLIALTSYTEMTKTLAMTHSTIVDRHYRGKGYGRVLNNRVEKYLKKRGYKKIVSHIYVDNLTSVVLKLKIGYLIEGLLRDHDFTGQHEYVLGKML